MSNLKPWLQSAYDEVTLALELNRLPSSIIISGDLRLQSASLAIAIAKLFLCENRQGKQPCGHCHSCMQLTGENLSHPDFLAVLSSTKDAFDHEEDLSHRTLDLLENTIRSDGTSLRIDTLRRFQDWIMQSSMGARGKVAVISNAHLMPEAAANAILKTFEEPPENTLIIMLTKSTDALLPTILSRAFKIYIKRPDFESACRELENMQVDTKYAAQALCLSADAPFAAADLIRSQKIEKILDLLKSLGDTLCNKQDPRDFIEKLFKKDLKVPLFTPQERVAILEEFLLELLKYKAHIAEEKLPLLVGLDLNSLLKIKAKQIFIAKNALKFLLGGNNMAPLRAPQIFMRSWIDNLKS
ncbi:MAG: hypothetical protein Q4E81_04560 [Succinatimonas sp.]|nr:hypothetical protein [Succinatimonas sp.]